jgi:lipoic acid synthetase
MVNRDDLKDGGASVMADTVRAVREMAPGCTIEVLTSDFMGSRHSVEAVVDSRPDIMSHNLETVRRLTPRVRSHSDYDRSLDVLRMSREIAPRVTTKSSLMLGLGETLREVIQAIDDLRSVDVDMINLGQYLQPTRTNIPVLRYWHPREFAGLKDLALQKGFIHCEAGPLVRSSYHAEGQYNTFRTRTAGRPFAGQHAAGQATKERADPDHQA